jgi:tetratricopeptide (TPR) repeat protein
MALAECLIRLNRDGEAEGVLRKMLTVPKPPELPERSWSRAMGMVHYQLGLVLASNASRIEDGIAQLKEATALIPQAARVYYNLGQAELQAGRVGEALAALERANELEPGDAQALVSLIQILREQRQWDRALGYGRKLAELLPGDAEVRRLLEDLQRQTTKTQP